MYHCIIVCYIVLHCIWQCMYLRVGWVYQLSQCLVRQLSRATHVGVIYTQVKHTHLACLIMIPATKIIITWNSYHITWQLSYLIHLSHLIFVIFSKHKIVSYSQVKHTHTARHNDLYESKFQQLAVAQTKNTISNYIHLISKALQYPRY